MKKTYIYLTFLFLGIALNSCKRIGKWDDNIKLSTKEFILEPSQSSYTITTQSTNWWLNGIKLNGNHVDISSIDNLSKNFEIIKPEFRIERKEDGKKIIIVMNKNSTNSDRILIVGLQNGDYFDGIKATQKK